MRVLEVLRGLCGGEERVMADPPPYQEAAQCCVCNCNFTTFKRRVWIVHVFVCVWVSLSLSLSRCAYFLVDVEDHSCSLFFSCLRFESQYGDVLFLF